MRHHHKVTIDGIEYVPLKNVLVDSEKFIRALLEDFWGVLDDETMEGLLAKASGLRIVVSDSFEKDRGISFEDLLSRIVKEA